MMGQHMSSLTSDTADSQASSSVRRMAAMLSGAGRRAMLIDGAAAALAAGWATAGFATEPALGPAGTAGELPRAALAGRDRSWYLTSAPSMPTWRTGGSRRGGGGGGVRGGAGMRWHCSSSDLESWEPTMSTIVCGQMQVQRPPSHKQLMQRDSRQNLTPTQLPVLKT